MRLAGGTGACQNLGRWGARQDARRRGATAPTEVAAGHGGARM